MIASKIFLFVALSALNFCNIEPPTGMHRVPRLGLRQRNYGDTNLPLRVEVFAVDVGERAAHPRDLEGYLAGLKGDPCCTPLRIKDLKVYSNPWLRQNHSVPAVPLIGPSPQSTATSPSETPSLAPPLPCQPWEQPKVNATYALQKLSSASSNSSQNLPEYLASLPLSNNDNTSFGAWQLDEKKISQVNGTLALTEPSFCPANTNVTTLYGQCPKNGTEIYEKYSFVTEPFLNATHGERGSTTREDADRREFVRSRLARINRYRKYLPMKDGHGIPDSGSKINTGTPKLERKVPKPRVIRMPSESLAGIRQVPIPLQPFIPVYLARVNPHQMRYSPTVSEPLLISFPGHQPSTSSLFCAVIQAIPSFPLKSVLCMSMVLETTLGLLMLTCTIQSRDATDYNSADEPRTVAMLEGQVMDSLPLEKLRSESCVVVNLSPTNSEQSLSEDDWEVPCV